MHNYFRAFTRTLLVGESAWNFYKLSYFAMTNKNLHKTEHSSIMTF